MLSVQLCSGRLTGTVLAPLAWRPTEKTTFLAAGRRVSPRALAASAVPHIWPIVRAEFAAEMMSPDIAALPNPDDTNPAVDVVVDDDASEVRALQPLVAPGVVARTVVRCLQGEGAKEGAVPANDAATKARNEAILCPAASAVFSGGGCMGPRMAGAP